MISDARRRNAGQAREIIRATLRQELRRSRGSSSARGKLGGLIALLVVYIFAGLLTAMSLALGIDPF